MMKMEQKEMDSKNSLPPFIKKTETRFDVMQYYIDCMEKRITVKIMALWVVVVPLCFLVGFLFARL